MVTRSDARRFGQSGSAQDHTRGILAAPETERGLEAARNHRRPFRDFQASTPGRERSAGHGSSSQPRARVFGPACSMPRSGRASPDFPEAGTAHASSTARRGCEAAPCPAKGKQERRRDIKERDHADGTNGIAARRLRDRGGGVHRRDVERRAPPRARHPRRMALLHRQGRRRRMAAMQHRKERMGQPRGRHRHARRPRPAARKNNWMLIIKDWWFTDEPFGHAE